MTEPLLDRSKLEEGIASLGRWATDPGSIGSVYLFGGNAMALAFDTRPATRDLDGRFSPEGPIQAEVLVVAREMGLPSSWLNQQGLFYLPEHHEPDPGPRR